MTRNSIHIQIDNSAPDDIGLTGLVDSPEMRGRRELALVNMNSTEVGFKQPPENTRHNLSADMKGPAFGLKDALDTDVGESSLRRREV